MSAVCTHSSPASTMADAASSDVSISSISFARNSASTTYRPKICDVDTTKILEDMLYAQPIPAAHKDCGADCRVQERQNECSNRMHGPIVFFGKKSDWCPNGGKMTSPFYPCSSRRRPKPGKAKPVQELEPALEFDCTKDARGCCASGSKVISSSLDDSSRVSELIKKLKPSARAAAGSSVLASCPRCLPQSTLRARRKR